MNKERKEKNGKVLKYILSVVRLAAPNGVKTAAYHS